MSGQNPEFSIIVLFGRDRLEPCLSSLLSQENANFEIIAVAGKSEPAVKDSRCNFIIVPDPNPARRRNLAVAASRGEFLAFIDDDAIAPKDWLAKAKAIFATRPDLAGLGGPNLAPENMDWREQLTDLILSDQYFGSGGGSYQAGGKTHPARPGELHLSNFFLRRECFDAVRGFNEKLGYGGEDSEMVYQIRKKTGRDWEFVPEVFVRHRRRKFGMELWQRNFRFRRRNGRMIWLHPDMYRWNFSLLMGAIVVILFFIVLWFRPIAAWGCVLFYGLFFGAGSLLRLKKRRWLCLAAPFAYFLHHSVYLLGLSAGLGEGMFRGRKELRQLLGRDNLE